MYWIDPMQYTNNVASNARVFNCDTLADIANLPYYNGFGKEQLINGEVDREACKPCALGSECICFNDGDTKVFKLSSNKESGINGWMML